jgi:CubicO group peptidase (beta-lactamase class C family)
MSDTFAEELRQSLPAEMERLNVPGCAVALIRDFAPTEIICFGTADRAGGEAVTADTRFSLQSVSKSIAAWAVMTLVEQGRLDLDRPIGDYHRRWTLPPSEHFDLSLVTPRRLLSHHAGVTVAGFRGVELDQTQYTLLDAMQGRLPQPNAEQTAHYEYWDLPRDDDIITVTHPPGQGWNYSNAGFGLLELGVEDITGTSFADYVAQAVFAPLGMDSACFARHEGLPYARPHNRQGQPIQDYRWLCGAAGGVYASIADLARFACAGMAIPGRGKGGGALSPASVETMHSDHGHAFDIDDRQFRAGLGHVILDLGGLLNVHHSGGSIGWRSIYSIFPDTGAGICMLMNAEGANELWQPVVFRWNQQQSQG